MKKTIIIMMGFLVIMCFTGSVYAATSAQTVAGGAVTVTPAVPANYPVLTFQPSPGILIDALTSNIAYGIVSASSKAGADGIAYNLISGNGVIYQDPISLAVTATSTGVTPVAGTAVSTFSSK